MLEYFVYHDKVASARWFSEHNLPNLRMGFLNTTLFFSLSSKIIGTQPLVMEWGFMSYASTSNIRLRLGMMMTFLFILLWSRLAPSHKPRTIRFLNLAFVNHNFSRNGRRRRPLVTGGLNRWSRRRRRRRKDHGMGQHWDLGWITRMGTSRQLHGRDSLRHSGKTGRRRRRRRTRTGGLHFDGWWGTSKTLLFEKSGGLSVVRSFKFVGRKLKPFPTQKSPEEQATALVSMNLHWAYWWKADYQHLPLLLFHQRLRLFPWVARSRNGGEETKKMWAVSDSPRLFLSSQGIVADVRVKIVTEVCPWCVLSCFLMS